MTLPAIIDLGAGHSATMIWRQGTDRDTGVPVGLLEMHGRCRTYITWVAQDSLTTGPEQGLVWKMISLIPLTVEPGVVCPTCGIVGRIKNGNYIQAIRVQRPQPAGGDQ